MPTWTQILIATLSAIGLATPGVLAYRAATKANRQQEAKDQRQDAVSEWKDLYDGVKRENRRLTERVAECEQELENLRREMTQMKAEMEKHMAEQDQAHARDRKAWERERESLYKRLFKLGDTPPPGSLGPVP